MLKQLPTWFKALGKYYGKEKWELLLIEHGGFHVFGFFFFSHSLIMKGKRIIFMKCFISATRYIHIYHPI